jgi:hypothetical protein
MSKPNNLPLSEYALRLATTLSSTGTIGTDVMLLPLLQYQRLMEEVRATFRLERNSVSQARLPLHARHFVAGLEEWRSGLPEALKDTCEMLQVSFQA